MNSIKTSVLAFFLALVSASSWALSQEDDASIKKSIAAYTSAWNERHMNDFSNAFAENASFIDVFGELFVGREAIRNRHLKMHENGNSRLKIEEIGLRMVRNDVVVALITWQVENSALALADSINDTRSGIFTQFFIKESDEWLIFSSQNTFTSKDKKCVVSW
jgi:uncharacterized protein (TIGR02246 family)